MENVHALRNSNRENLRQMIAVVIKICTKVRSYLAEMCNETQKTRHANCSAQRDSNYCARSGLSPWRFNKLMKIEGEFFLCVEKAIQIL